MRIKVSTSSIIILSFGVVALSMFRNMAFAYELEQYYPLGEGDSWTYRVVEDNETHEKVVRINGMEIIDGKDMIGIFSGDDNHKYVGIDSQGVWIYKTFGEDAYEIYNPPMVYIPRILIGDSREYPSLIVEHDIDGREAGRSDNTIKITVEAIESVEVVAGKFDGCLKYYSVEKKQESRDFSEREVCTFWLAPNVGKVKEICVEEHSEDKDNREVSIQKSELISAVIGGKRIGNP